MLETDVFSFSPLPGSNVTKTQNWFRPQILKTVGGLNDAVQPQSLNKEWPIIPLIYISQRLLFLCAISWQSLFGSDKCVLMCSCAVCSHSQASSLPRTLPHNVSPRVWRSNLPALHNWRNITTTFRLIYFQASKVKNLINNVPTSQMYSSKILMCRFDTSWRFPAEGCRSVY